MAMFQRQSGVQRLQQRADPQLLLTNRILQMSALELRQCVVQELDENPALECVEEAGCGHCDNPALQCPECPHAGRFQPLAERESPRPLGMAEREEDLDPFARVPAECTLREHLLSQLGAAVRDPEDLRIGQLLIESLDDDGYLRASLEEVAAALEVPAPRVERLLTVVQGFDPSGVGARSLQECLLIQARSGRADMATPALVERILADHWREFVAGKQPDIARRLRTPLGRVEEAVTWLRANLSPYPGSQYRPSWQREANGGPQAIRPDVYVALDDEGRLGIELAREDLPAIYVSPHYHQLFKRLREDPESLDPGARRHVREYLQRAQMFLKGLQDRSGILRQVAECILEEQEPYLRSEREEDMRPLTQSQLASFLRVHESTVSRAVAEKFLQLPSGRVVPLSHFFDRALSHRKLVANIVASENPAHPYSDQEISEILCRQGVRIARRTVMKYREEMNILSSRRRARAGA